MQGRATIPMKFKPVSLAPKLPALAVAAVLLASCGGGGGGAPATIPTNAGGNTGPLRTPPPTTGPATTLNTLRINVDAGPVPTLSRSINVAYVTVTVCAPGTTPATAACQTIDHVMVDTGSSGLRLLKSALYSSLKLPQVLNSAGNAIGECTSFVIGATWGSVRSADIYLGGELVSNASFQDIGDTPGGATGVPVDCSGTGTIQGDTGILTIDQEQLGANGILGVGQLPNDCPPCLIPAPGYYVPATYYNCNSAGCSNAPSVTSSQIVQNPVALLPQDNNGVLIDLSSTNPYGTYVGSGTSGYTALSGSLILGIGTESNNTPTLGSGQNEYDADIYGNLLTSYTDSVGGTTPVPMLGVLDSGSNGVYFPDSTIAQCTGQIGSPWYCPDSNTLSLVASNQSNTADVSAYVPVTFTLASASVLLSNPANIIGANIGADFDFQPELGSNLFSAAYPMFDWGLPFFYNQPVYTGIAGATAASGVSATGVANGYWIY